jgi:hypothetical protein
MPFARLQDDVSDGVRRAPDRTSATAAHSKATDTAIDDGASTAHPHRSQHLRPRPAVQRTTAMLNGHDPIPVGSSVSNVTAHLRAVAALVPLVCHQVEHHRWGSSTQMSPAITTGSLPTSLTFTVRCHVG